MRRLNQVTGIDTGTNLVAELSGKMKNYRDNGEGVKHGVVHLQLGHYEIKTQRELCEKAENNYGRQVGCERTNENIKQMNAAVAAAALD